MAFMKIGNMGVIQGCDRGSLAKGGSLKSISDRFSASKALKNFDK